MVVTLYQVVTGPGSNSGVGEAQRKRGSIVLVDLVLGEPDGYTKNFIVLFEMIVFQVAFFQVLGVAAWIHMVLLRGWRKWNGTRKFYYYPDYTRYDRRDRRGDFLRRRRWWEFGP